MNRVLAIVCCLVALCMAYLSRGAISDDAYITLRIARHALEGHGLHYNIGETGVQAATSPLNLVLALVVGKAAMLFGTGIESGLLNAPATISFLTLPALALGVFVLLARHSRNLIGPLLGSVSSVVSPILLFSAGLETQLLLALIVWALVAMDANKFALSGALCGLAVLARHDALILLLVISGAICFSKDRSSLLKFLGPAILVVGPWILFSAVTFRETVPTTLASKMAQGGTAYWPGSYYAQFWKWAVNCAFDSPWIAAALCALACFGAVCGLRSKNRAVTVLATYFALQFAAYSVFNVPDYHWYFAPYFVAISILTGYAIGKLKSSAGVVVLGGAVALALFILANQKAPRLEDRFFPYQEVGRYIEGHPPKTAVGLMEIGIIGFFAPDVNIFDFSGIVTPAQIPRVKENSANAWMDDPSIADVVVTRGVKHPLEPDFDPRFEGLYVLEFTTQPSKAYPGGLQIWRLKQK